jgi:hypothetical protein
MAFPPAEPVWTDPMLARQAELAGPMVARHLAEISR